MRKKKLTKKKGDAEPEMGYCPFEHKVRLGAGLRGRDTRRRAAQHGCWASRRPWSARARGAGAGRALGHDTGAWGARGTRDTGAGHARGVQVYGLGVLLGCGLCTWCTQLVFDPV